MQRRTQLWRWQMAVMSSKSDPRAVQILEMLDAARMSAIFTGRVGDGRGGRRCGGGEVGSAGQANVLVMGWMLLSRWILSRWKAAGVIWNRNKYAT